ncbi:hypothetical protein ACE38F_12070 [Bacillus mycoides]|uniref:hypothetical protein n=1 Tax=Bacillus mycoides TaxID=1405 RepID=UPI0035CBB648
MKWKREDTIFETIRESELWADSIANEMYGRVFDGYETPDYKIAYALSFFLAQNQELNIHTEVECNKNKDLYNLKAMGR